MPGSFRFVVLPLGQGTGTLIELLDGTGKPTEISLIDLGSKGWASEIGVPSAEFVIAELKKMDEPRLKTIFLSHSDGDHVNLIKRVLDRFKKPSEHAPAKQTLIVQEVWYGGNKADYTKTTGKGKKRKKLDLIEFINGYRRDGDATNINTLGAGVCDWARKPLEPLWRTGGGISYWLLYGNGSKTTVASYLASTSKKQKGSKGYLKNVVSLVLIVEYGDPALYFVAMGDATGLTIAGCNEMVRKYKIDLPVKVSTMSLPHHGSKTTTYDFLGTTSATVADRDAFAKQSVQEFITSFQPSTINASAGEQTTFKHPAWEVVEDFGRYLSTGRYVDPQLTALGQHFFTGYYTTRALTLHGDPMRTDWPPAAGWQTGRTDKNVFTVDYYRLSGYAGVAVPTVFPPNATVSPAATYAAKPPRAAGWAWVTDGDGTYSIERMLDKNFTARAVLDAYEAEHGPLPAERFVFVPSAKARPEQSPPPSPPPATVDAAPPPGDVPPAPPGLRGLRQLP